MILQRGKKGMEYLHAALLFAMAIPLLYAFPKWSDPAGTFGLYLKCLLIVVPIIVTERAARQIKSVILYFLISVLLVAAVGVVTGLISYLTGGRGSFEGHEIGYCVIMLLETLFIIVKRFADRVRKVKWKREEPLAAEAVSFLDHPTVALVWYFVVLYALGLLLDAKLLCDTAFYSAIAYTFLALGYEYLGTTKAYLEMNKRTKGIPKRRLYGVSFAMLLVFASLLLIGMMPSILLSGLRQYTDIRDWFGDVGPVPAEYEYEGDIALQPPAAGGMGGLEFLEDGRPAPEPSKIAMVLFWAVGIGCVLVFVYGIIQMIRQVLRDFRNSRDENGDMIEELEDDPDAKQKVMVLNRKGRRGAESEAQRIRRRYRRTIRKHRKERPAPYESPAEIEEYAGLKNDEQMQQLHKEYEEVRYGKL